MRVIGQAVKAVNEFSLEKIIKCVQVRMSSSIEICDFKCEIEEAVRKMEAPEDSMIFIRFQLLVASQGPKQVKNPKE